MKPALAFALLILCTASLHAVPPAGKPQQPASPDQVPEGLAKSDWSSIRAAYEAGRHAFQPVEGGWQARNPGQQWTTRFDGRGFIAQPRGADWQWGLELKSYGFAGKERTLGSAQQKPAARADGQRLTYSWDDTVQEWWVNDQRGLEHGFTLKERPGQKTGRPGDETWRKAGTASPPSLTFTLAVRGTLKPQVAADALGIEFRDAAGTTVLNYSGLKVWDADGKVLDSRFESAGENSVRLLVDERSARYPITIDPIAQQAYVKASNTGAGDQFGCSVAISGDTVVVGAFAEASSAAGVNGNQADNSLTQAGAAYVFTRSVGGVWTQQAYLKASDPDGYEVFGYSVAIEGDTIVIGAYGDYLNFASGVSGAAYVFTRSAGVWTPQAELRASNLEDYDSFGSSVAISGDTAVIGAPGEDSNALGVGGNQGNNGAVGSGAAYVFTRSAGVWTQQAYLKASNTGTSDTFGITLAVSGDTAVIGAPGEDSDSTGVGGSQANNNALNSGAAYIFTRSAGVWAQQAYLKASNSRAYNPFGNSVALSGDTALIGSSQDDSNATGVNGNQANTSALRAGAAYVFTRSAGLWTQEAYLKASNTGSEDRFGHSVALSGDTAVIGSNGEDSNATGVGGNQANNSAADSGAAYVFSRSAGVWTQQAYLKASSIGPGDRFGHSVAVAGDTFVIGAIAEDSNATAVDGNQADNSATEAGAAYIFSGSAPVTLADVAVTQGTALTDGVSSVAFGTGVVSTPTPLTFTITNPGTAALTSLAVTKDGANAGDFTVSALSATSIPVGAGTVTFTVTFSPTSASAKTAAIHIASNVVGTKNPFDIALTGTGQTPTQAVDGALTAAGLSGPNAALDATPYHDGVENLLKYAFNMNLSGPDAATMPPGGSSGLPGIAAQPNGATSIFRYEFLRRKNSGLIYTPQKTPDISNPIGWVSLTDTPTITSLDTNWERVIYEEPYNAGTTPKCFGRVEVTLP